MPNVTIQGSSLCGGGNHRTVTTDQGSFVVTDAELTTAVPETFAQLKEASLIILRHQYLTRRAAGRTHTQALSDLIGFVVRM